jgi:nuclear cap-binding protein subunit 1
MRLSYYQRIIEMLPETMKQLLPEQPKPVYKYESEEAANLEGTPIANRLLEKIKQRCMPEDIIQLLRETTDDEMIAEADDIDNEQLSSTNRLKIDVFTSTLLYFGSKSFSHIFAALAKYEQMHV